MKNVIIILISMFSSIVMASTNEISITIDFQVKKNSLELLKSPGTINAQMTGTKYFSQIYTATTTNQNLSKGSIGNMGWSYLRNISSNVWVYISTSNGADTNFCLLPTEAAVIRFAPSCNITTIQYSVTNGTADFEFSPIEK